MKRPTLTAAIRWIVDNDDTSIPTPMRAEPIEYLSGLVSIALVADLFGVEPETLARKVHDLSERRRAADDEAWRREQAIEAGMLHGIEAFNDLGGM